MVEKSTVLLSRKHKGRLNFSPNKLIFHYNLLCICKAFYKERFFFVPCIPITYRCSIENICIQNVGSKLGSLMLRCDVKQMSNHFSLYDTDFQSFNCEPHVFLYIKKGHDAPCIMAFIKLLNDYITQQVA